MLNILLVAGCVARKALPVYVAGESTDEQRFARARVELQYMRPGTGNLPENTEELPVDVLNVTPERAMHGAPCPGSFLLVCSSPAALWLRNALIFWLHGGDTLADKDLHFLKDAPPKSWLALNDDETRVLAVASSLRELEAKIEAEGLHDVVVWKTPPSKGRPAY